MNKKRFVRGFAVSVILLATLAGFVAWSSIFYTPNVHALAKGDASPTDIMKKALVQNMHVCYDWYYMHTPLRSDKAKMGDGQNNNIFNSYSKEDLLPIPTLVGNTIKDSNVSCAQSVAGYNKSGQKLTGLLSLFGKPAFDGDGAGTNMVAIGYTPVPKEEENQPEAGKHTFKISYTYQDTVDNKLGSAKTSSISVTFGANGGVISNPDGCYENDGMPKDSSKMFCIDTANSILQNYEGKLWGTVNALSYRYGVPYTWLAAYQISLDDGKIDFSGIPSWHQQQTDCGDQVIGTVEDPDTGLTVSQVFYACSENVSRKFSDLKVEYKFEADDSQAMTREEFEITDFDAARQHFISYLGATSYDSTWTANEKFTVYYSYYIARVKNDNKSNGYLSVDEKTCVDSLNGGILAVGNNYYLPHNGKWCKVNIEDNLVVKHGTVANDEGKFAILTGKQTKMASGKDADAFREVVRELMKIHDQIDIGDAGEIGNVPAPDPTPDDPNPGPGQEPEPGNDGSTVSNCIDSAGPLGWIICPTLKLAGTAAEKLYGYIEDSFLWIGSDVMGTNKSVHQAWGEFRNYANIAFIIVFLVVILSQITGFGISNYGIKKILPRLIAVALLTNLSFIICQLAVDLSDIVGSGIKAALSSNSFTVVGAVDSEYGVNNIISDIFGVLFAGAGTVGAGYLAAVTWELWLLPLLLAIITALIGVFVFFLSLAVRQAGIIILVILCPVAIVCYTLPNTKKLFDKWFRMFTSLLMVYPICGLLMGGGQLASKILVSLSDADDPKFMLTLTAMLLSVAPFFFIPTIVRTSLNAIGQLGARLSNFGRGMGGRLTGAIRGSERFKDAQRELATRHDEATVRRLDSRAARRVKKGKVDNGGYTAASSRRRLRAYMRSDKARREDLLGEAYGGRALLQDDEGRREQMLADFSAKYSDELEASAKALYQKRPEMAHEDGITKEYDSVLAQFGDDPDNIQLQGQLRALQAMDMGKGAPGQDAMQQSIAKWIATNNANNSWNDNKRNALKKLSAGLSTRYGKEINSSDKGFITQLSDFAKGDWDKLSSFRKATGKDGKDIYLSDYDTKLSSFSAAGLKNATPGALQRGAEIMRNGTFKDAATEQAMLGKITQAFNDRLIANDIKPTEKGYIQEILGYGAAKGGHDVFTNMEQGTIDNLAQFIDNADRNDARDLSALQQLGANIASSANNGRLYSENDTKRIQRMLGVLNGKTGTTYEFNPSAVQVRQGDQGNSSPIITGDAAEEAFRNRNRS